MRIVSSNKRVLTNFHRLLLLNLIHMLNISLT
nr:MAG TPA: hypothetical protein [Caudoviricetes sp.]